MQVYNFESFDALLSVGTFILVLVALLFLRRILARYLGHFRAEAGVNVFNYAEQVVLGTRLPFLIGIAVLAAFTQLDLGSQYAQLVRYAWIVVLVTQVALWGTRVIGVATNNAFAKHRQNNPSGATHLMVVALIGRILLWAIALLVMLDNLGFEVKTLMASLGIGGVAVALAVQNILGDLFSSVSIALDKPFVIGDFIVVDQYMGTVEYVGLKTTRIRSLSGEQIIISNTELLKQRIRNYQRLQERRVLFEFGVAHDTPTELVENIPPMVAEIIGDERLPVRFDRAHFRSYSETALQFEVVYYVLTPDYNRYMDVQQQINFELLRRFRAQGIAFAQPIRNLHVSRETAQMINRSAAQPPRVAQANAG